MDDDIKLGADVTALFRAAKRPETTVLSVRLPIADFVQLERQAIATGQSVSALARSRLATETSLHVVVATEDSRSQTIYVGQGWTR